MSWLSLKVYKIIDKFHWICKEFLRISPNAKIFVQLIGYHVHNKQIYWELRIKTTLANFSVLWVTTRIVVARNMSSNTTWYKRYHKKRCISWLIVEWIFNGSTKTTFVEAVSHQNSYCQMNRAIFVVLPIKLLFYQVIKFTYWFNLVQAIEKRIFTFIYLHILLFVSVSNVLRQTKLWSSLFNSIQFFFYIIQYNSISPI